MFFYEEIPEPLAMDLIFRRACIFMIGAAVR
jgi:hypothetical protein